MAHWTFTIGGTVIDMDAADAIMTELVTWSKGGMPSLTLQRRAVPLAALPDPWVGQTITADYTNDVPVTTRYFKGQVVDAIPEHGDRGWVLTYPCMGLRWLADWVPVTDENTGTDPILYNMPFDDLLNYIAARAGRTVGQIITDVLTMPTNAARLDAFGVGAYTSLTPPTLPAATVSDLATMTFVPPGTITLSGEKLLSAIEGLVSNAQPNHAPHVQPDGTIRFLDLRSFTPVTLTHPTDQFFAPSLGRSTRNSAPRVQVRGLPIAEPAQVGVLDGTLLEFFGRPGVSSSSAKAAWVLNDFLRSQSAADSGGCTCPSTTTVTVTSSSGTTFWATNFWDQTATGKKGVLLLRYSLDAGTINMTFSARIIACTSLSAGGTSTLTLDRPMPILSYDHYSITGLQDARSIVWRLYKVANTVYAAKLAAQLTYPFAWSNGDGTGATSTRYPTSRILFGGGPDYARAPLGFTMDRSAGTILFDRPVVMLSDPDTTRLNTAGGYTVPHDVQMLLAINKDNLLATSPADSGGVAQYSGTSNSVEGLARTLYVSVPSWTDYGNQTSMNTYASELHDTVKDTVVSGPLAIVGLREDFLTPGVAVNLAANYGAGAVALPGWGGLDLPIVEARVKPGQGDGAQHWTNVSLSNRRAAFTADSFLRPPIVGAQLGFTSGDGGQLQRGVDQGTPDMMGAMGFSPPPVPTAPSIPVPDVPAPPPLQLPPASPMEGQP